MTAGRFLGVALAGYLLGTIPSARLAARALTGGAVDLTKTGTRNPGARNAGRVLGRRAGVLIGAADVAKGVAACALGAELARGDGAHVAGVASVAGHCFPVWTGFRGGMGVATSYGQCLATLPLYAPVDAAIAARLYRVPGLPRPAFVSTAAAGLGWLGASLLWWRRGLPNLWGPAPSRSLPLACAATLAVLALRVAAGLRREPPDP